MQSFFKDAPTNNCVGFSWNFSKITTTGFLAKFVYDQIIVSSELFTLENL